MTPGAARAAADIDAADTRVRVRREHHHRMRLVRQLEVIDEVAASGEEARILDATHGLANAVGLSVELLVHACSLIFIARAPFLPRRAAWTECARRPCTFGLSY